MSRLLGELYEIEQDILEGIVDVRSIDDEDSEEGKAKGKDIGDPGNTTSFFIGDIKEVLFQVQIKTLSVGTTTVDTKAMDTITILRKKLRNKIDTMFTGLDVDQPLIAEDRMTFESKEENDTT